MKAREGTPVRFVSPLRFFFRVLAIVLLAEILEEVALRVLHAGVTDATKPIVNALLVGMLIAPALWWFVARPLRGVAMGHMRAAMAVSHAADGVITISEAGLVELFNPAAERLFGYREAEALGKRLTNLMPERYRETHQRRLEQVLTSRKPELPGETQELHGLRKDGSEFPLEVSLGCWRVGTQSFCTGIVRDITERKRAEERYRRLFEEAPVMYVIGRSGAGGPVIADCNALFLRTLGYARAEVLGRPVAAFYTPESRAKLLDLGGYQRALDGRFGVEGRELVTRDGRVIPFLVRSVPEIDPAGQASGTRAMYLDITERKRAEDALKEEEEKYRNLVETSHDLIWSADAQGRVTFVNRTARIIYGYEPQEVIGRPFADFLAPEQAQKDLEAFERVIAGGEVAMNYETEVIRKDGARVLLNANAVVLRDAQGYVIGITGSAQDITEGKRAEEAVRERTRQLDAARAVGSEITRELELSTLLELITRRAAELVGATSGVISLWDGEAQLLIPQAWHGFGDWMSEMSIPLGLGVTGTVAERREGMIVNDYRCSRLALPQFLERTQITAVMAEPLLYRDRLVGAITINNERVGRLFEEKDSETLRLFATQAAIAIENARLHEAVIRRAQQLATLNELSRTLTTVLDPQGVIREILAAVQTLIPGAVCRL